MRGIRLRLPPLAGGCDRALKGSLDESTLNMPTGLPMVRYASMVPIEKNDPVASLPWVIQVLDGDLVEGSYMVIRPATDEAILGTSRSQAARRRLSTSPSSTATTGSEKPRCS